MALAALEVEDLSYSYLHGVSALRGVSFSIAHGERVALLGPNGAGKSTLLWCLVGILRAQGRIAVDGTVLRPGTEADIRRKLGLAFAEPEDQLFMPTIERDVTFGLLAAGNKSQQAGQKAREAVTRVGLGEHLLERAAHELSSGERRRAALASILVLDPVVLALDEPTNSLDAKGRAALAGILFRLPCAQLVATHDIGFARCLCDRALVLVDGALVADRPFCELLSDAQMLQQYGLTATITTEDGQTALL